jgi:hypothetical protein
MGCITVLNEGVVRLLLLLQHCQCMLIILLRSLTAHFGDSIVCRPLKLHALELCLGCMYSGCCRRQFRCDPESSAGGNDSASSTVSECRIVLR